MSLLCYRKADGQLLPIPPGGDQPAGCVPFGTTAFFEEHLARAEEDHIGRVGELVEEGCRLAREKGDDRASCDGWRRFALETLTRELSGTARRLRQRHLAGGELSDEEGAGRLRGRAHALRALLGDLGASDLTFLRGGEGPFVAPESSVWSDSLGHFVRMIQLVAAHGRSPFTIDEGEMAMLSAAARRSENPEVRALFSAILSEGSFVTRRGGTGEEGDGATPIAGLNLCLNFSSGPRKLPCMERSLFGYDYQVLSAGPTEGSRGAPLLPLLSPVPPSSFPAIDGALRRRFAEEIEREGFGLFKHPVGVAVLMREIVDHAANDTLFEHLSRLLFRTASIPGVALLFQMALLNIVLLHPSLDQRTKQHRAGVIQGHLEEFNRRFKEGGTAEKRFLQRRIESPGIEASGGGGSVVVLSEWPLEKLSSGMRDLQQQALTSLAAIDEVGRWIEGRICEGNGCKRLEEEFGGRGEITKAWRSAFAGWILPSPSGEGELHRLLEWNDDHADGKGNDFAVRLLEWLYSHERLQRFKGEQERLSADFASASATVYDAFWSGRAGWLSLGGMLLPSLLNSQKSGPAPLFWKAKVGGTLASLGTAALGFVAGAMWDKSSSALAEVERPTPLLAPSVAERLRLAMEGREEGTRDAGDRDEGAAESASHHHNDNGGTGFVALAEGTAVPPAASAPGWISKVQPGQCALSFVALEVMLWQVARLVGFDDARSVRPFVTGIGRQGELIQERGTHLGAWLPWVGMLITGGAGLFTCWMRGNKGGDRPRGEGDGGGPDAVRPEPAPIPPPEPAREPDPVVPRMPIGETALARNLLLVLVVAGAVLLFRSPAVAAALLVPAADRGVEGEGEKGGEVAVPAGSR